MIVYRNKAEYAEHVALVKGDLSAPGPVLVRMHGVNLVEDVLGDKRHDRGDELHRAMRMIDEAGRGVVVLLREPRSSALSERVAALLKDPTSGAVHELRDYGVGAQILLDLGVRDMILLSNTRRTIVGLEGYGLTVVEHRPLTPSSVAGSEGH
jgi:3,4-dihydroxy 2-butanone 4-phosphate synthase / GTP cyclohydrolase II